MVAQECALDHGEDGGAFVGVELVESFESEAELVVGGAALIFVEDERGWCTSR